MATAAKYSDELKAAVMAALLTGQSVSSVAREYNLPKGTVSSWKDRSHEVATVATQPDLKNQDLKRDIGSLLLEYLIAALGTLKAQVEVFGDREWLKKQPASEVAVLHGVIADKTVRLLEGLADSGSPDAGV